MLPKGDFFNSRLWVVSALLCLSAAVAFAQPIGRADTATGYLPSQFESQGKQTNATEAISRARSVLSQREDPNITAVMFNNVRQNSLRTQAIAAESGDKAEKMKAEQVLWQSSVARQEMDQILGFHVQTKSDLASRFQWFWSNHFSVFGMKRNVKLLLADYDANALAPNLMGRFDKLLVAAVMHPAMVIYLDNSSNRKSKGNENLAREILELHTMGVNSGYSQADVQSLARALTGITVASFKSSYEVNDCQSPKCIAINRAGTVLERQQHDDTPKVLLGKKYQRDDGLEVLDMLADLAMHPSTAKHLSRKLLQYFLMDEPDPKLVDRLSLVYLKNQGDLSVVYRELFSLQTQGVTVDDRFSDPFTYLMRVVRVLGILGGGYDYSQLNRILREWGQGLYQRVTPDGYPLESTYWSGAAALTERLDAVDQLVKSRFNGRGSKGVDAQVQSMIKVLRPRLSPTTREMLGKYEKDALTWLAYALVSPELVF